MTHWNALGLGRACDSNSFRSRPENSNAFRKKTPTKSNIMSTQEHPNAVFTIQHVVRKTFSLTAVALFLAAAVSAQTLPQIGLKFGINGLTGLQNTNVGALQPGDLAGAPGYVQTNWNVLGYRG